MINKTIQFAYDSNEGDNVVTIRCLVESVNDTKMMVRDIKDEIIVIDMENVVSISIVDEDDHHEFTADVFGNRLKNEIESVYKECVRKAGNIAEAHLFPIEIHDVMVDLADKINYNHKVID